MSQFLPCLFALNTGNFIFFIPLTFFTLQIVGNMLFTVEANTKTNPKN